MNRLSFYFFNDTIYPISKRRKARGLVIIRDDKKLFAGFLYVCYSEFMKKIASIALVSLLFPVFAFASTNYYTTGGGANIVGGGTAAYICRIATIAGSTSDKGDGSGTSVVANMNTYWGMTAGDTVWYYSSPTACAFHPVSWFADEASCGLDREKFTMLAGNTTVSTSGETTPACPEPTATSTVASSTPASLDDIGVGLAMLVVFAEIMLLGALSAGIRTAIMKLGTGKLT